MVVIFLAAVIMRLEGQDMAGHTESTIRKQSQQEVELSFEISRPLPVTHFYSLLPVRLGVLKGSQPSLTVPPARDQVLHVQNTTQGKANGEGRVLPGKT